MATIDPERADQPFDGVERRRSSRVRQVQFRDPAIDTFDLLRRWKRFQTVNGMAEITITHYGQWLLRFLWFYMGPIARATEEDLIEFIDSYDPHGGARGHSIRALRSFYTWAYEADHIGKNPARRLRSKRPKYGPAPYLTPEELTRLVIAAAWRHPVRGWAIILMYATGIRAQSAIHLQPGDVRGGRLHVRVAKGDRPYSVPLNHIGAEAAAELVALAAVRPARPPMGRPRSSQWRGNPKGTAARGRVPLAGEGTLLGVGYGRLHQWFQQAGQDAGLDRAYPHLMRHSFATRLAEHQVQSRTIQELLNHADLSQLTRYVTVADPAKRAAVELLDRDF